MSPTTLRYDRPDSTEYAPFHAAYVALVPDGDVLALLEAQIGETSRVLRALPESRGGHAYAPGKWTIREVVCHVADAERVFSYRALRIARGDTTPLAAFDEQAWAPQSEANRRTLADLLDELLAVRASTLALFKHLPAEAPLRRGVASGYEVSVRGLAWVITGHERHHLRILRERYLG